MADLSVIPSQANDSLEPGEPGAETSPIDALKVMSSALASLVPRDDVTERQVEVPESVVQQIVLLMIDYRRLLEGVGLQIAALPISQRDSALTAYQHVCQTVFDALRIMDCLPKGVAP